MSLVRLTPRQNGTEVAALRTEVDHLFEGLLTPMTPRSRAGVLVPAVDIEETPESYVFRADLPGVDVSQVKVTVTGDTLTFKGERRPAAKATAGAVQRLERSYGSFERSFTLGVAVRTDAVKASYRDGVLEIHVPKADEARPRDVEIQLS